jgi:hypothetical protein
VLGGDDAATCAARIKRHLRDAKARDFIFSYEALTRQQPDLLEGGYRCNLCLKEEKVRSLPIWRAIRVT